MQKLDRRKNLV